jgi:hypothetical protein
LIEALLLSLMLTAREKEERERRADRERETQACLVVDPGANEIAFEIAACLCLEGRMID